MTLLLTEMTDKGVIFAADRNLTWLDTRSGKLQGLAYRRKKIMGIEYLSAAIGYFGNAHVGRKKTLMDEWLESFILENSSSGTLERFANCLKDRLEATLTQAQKQRMLGFHLAGYTEQEGVRLPTFWYVSNIQGMRGPFYVGVNDGFAVSEDFLNRDLRFVKPDLLHASIFEATARLSIVMEPWHPMSQLQNTSTRCFARFGR